jgi:hypothetical protein
MKRGTFIGKIILNFTNYLFLILILATAAPLNAQSSGEKNILKFEDLLLKAAAAGNVRVIIKLDVQDIDRLQSRSRQFTSPAPGRARTWGGADADRQLADAIATSAEYVNIAMGKAQFAVHRIYKSIPYMALEVSPEALTTLEFMPEVLAIEEDVPMPLPDPVQPSAPSDLDQPQLNNTVNITGASAAWSMGYTGAGWYVAILDTGIRKTHEMFAGKTIVEACYALGQDGVGPAGDCPNGLTSMIGSGAAAHYPTTADAAYDHGTHVAGIATGHSATLSGMAKDANIIAVKVFSMFDATYCGGSACILSYTSDLIAGLDYVYSIRGSYSIAAVNMSLGGGRYYDSATCDSANTARKASIDNLRSAGIASAISSGNNGYCDSLGAPGCISTAVSVGASDDSDVEAWFSNWQPAMLKLFAPGVGIYSSTGDSDTSYESWDGTSMAAPHVTGAWALIKQAIPSGSVTDILSTLRNTGVNISSVCSDPSITVPRIQIDDAITALLPIAKNPNDFNGDGKTDIVWRNMSTGETVVWYMDGVTFTGSGWLGTIDPVWEIAGVADFNNDTKPDIVWRNSSDGGTVVWYMDGVTFIGSGWLGTIDPVWEIAGVADFNNDTKPDILWRNSSTGGTVVWYMDGVTFTGAGGLGTIDPVWEIPGVADFNNDTKPDIVWRNSSTGGNVVWYMDGVSYTGAGGLGIVDTIWDLASAADFNNDGKPDIVWRNTSTGGNVVWYMDGVAFTGAGGLGTVDTSWQIAAP